MKLTIDRVLEAVMWALLLVFMFWGSSAFAIDFSQKINDAEGKPMQVDGKDLTVGRAAAGALFASLPGDDKATAEEKYNRAVLATKVKGAGELDLAAEEIALIKKVVGVAYGPLVVMQVFDAVDPGVKSNPVKTETVPAPKE